MSRGQETIFMYNVPARALPGTRYSTASLSEFFEKFFFIYSPAASYGIFLIYFFSFQLYFFKINLINYIWTYSADSSSVKILCHRQIIKIKIIKFFFF